jgi:NADH-quinone oxidoreductase subunit L
MTPVDLVWLVPALPLAALIVNGLISLATRTTPPPAPVPAGHVAHDGMHSGAVADEHTDTAADHQAAVAVASEHEEEHGAAHGGHGEHGAPTPLPRLVGAWLGVLALFGSFVLSLLILFQFLGDAALMKNGKLVHLYDWFSFGTPPHALNYVIDFRVDTLTVVMLIVVTSVSMLVHLYSIGYMAGDRGFATFFAELAIFTVAMLILVLAANFLVLFIGWELVGLSSYLLIGFWYYHEPPPPGSEVPYPPPSQLKAFVTTRLGDFGFMIGILILFFNTGTFDFVQLNAATQHVDKAVMTLAMILVFCGAIGKSAQFPLHVWLPDAMAGPTPVSALIHAATMVAAGVYLVARLFPIYAVSAGPQALAVVGYIGAFTAFFAATIALTQHDIKGVLAYSTISQLGYMFAGLAVAPTNALGMFHLFTHAFFKALLFLCSGSVIHAVVVQDMRKMGGLARALPITAGCLLVANLAISGIPPFSGFWSKDPIIAAAYDNGNYVIWGLTLFTAFLTAFYMFRLFFLTFGGRGGAFGGLWGGPDQYRGEAAHPHESPPVMWIPLVLLAGATIVIGLFGFAGLNQGFAWFLNGGANVTYPVAPALDLMTLVGVGTGVVGILLAWAVYGLGWGLNVALAKSAVTRPVYTLLYRRYFLNELYGWIIKYIVLGLANLCALFDAYVIDGIVNGSARFVRGLGSVTRRSETGVVQNYGAALFGGAIIIMLIIFFATGAIGK